MVSKTINLTAIPEMNTRTNSRKSLPAEKIIIRKAVTTFKVAKIPEIISPAFCEESK